MLVCDFVSLPLSFVLPFCLRPPQVRKNTLLVLTHLILNDMVKVKGEISEVAVRLEDPDPKIAALARSFFQALAKRGLKSGQNERPRREKK